VDSYKLFTAKHRLSPRKQLLRFSGEISWPVTDSTV